MNCQKVFENHNYFYVADINKLVMKQACSDEKKLKIKESMQATRAKRTKQVCRVFKVKIDSSKLTKKQKEQLKMMFVEAKWIKNSRIAWARENNKSIFECKDPVKGEIIKVKNKDGEFEERQLKYIGSQMGQGILAEMKSNTKTIITLTKKGLQRCGNLNFVSEVRSLHLSQYGTTYEFKSSKKLKIQRVSGLVYVNGAKQFYNNPDIEIASAKLLNTPKGYYLAITTFIDKDCLSKTNFNGKTIALDLGCSTSITYSDGRKQSILIEESEHLKRLQQKFARQKKGSNNRNRTRKLLQKQYQKLTNRKNDAANKVVAELKHYNAVVFQDEQLAKWQEDGHGRKIQHGILGRVKTKLKLANNTIMLAATIPTTKICMRCGKVHDVPLSQRTFKCFCGCTEDRDVHAAQNMLDIASLILNNDLKNVPVGRRELKREEFLQAYQKQFEVDYETMIHEGRTL